MPTTQKSPRPRIRLRPKSVEAIYLESFSIRGLFGKISYDRIGIRNPVPTESRVSVLYGENGVGKTTILRLIYSALAPQSNAGLRSFIARTPFEKFTLNLSGGIEINIQKLGGLAGDYRFSVKRGRTTQNFEVTSDEDGDVPQQDSVAGIEKALREISIDILFVDHSRTVRSTYAFLSEISGGGVDHLQRWLHNQNLSKRESIDAKGYYRVPESAIQLPLAEVVDAVDRWLRAQAFRQGSAGEQNASAVYLEITKALVRPQRGRTDDITKADVRDTLLSLKSVTESFVKHGLLSPYPFDDLVGIFDSASSVKQRQIEVVLAPFLDSIQRRISALNEVHDVVTIFEAELNRYFSGKVASVHIAGGLSISDESGILDIDLLSSGEKQLVFLLSSAVVSRSARSLILIDEPELSLNYRWQRVIAESLSNISSATNTQFILASHSVEIISRYVESAIELSPK